MAVKVCVLLAMLVFAGVVSPIAHAQVGGIVASVLNITGVVPCSIGNFTNLPNVVFPNAVVQLRCGGNVTASATTNSAGQFLIAVEVQSILLTVLLNSCILVVTTPLVSCNASLPSTGSLTSLLNVTDIVSGGVTNLIPGNFFLVPGTG